MVGQSSHCGRQNHSEDKIRAKTTIISTKVHMLPMRARVLAGCDGASPRLAGTRKARSDRNSHCDYPRHENQHDSCCLEDKDSKRQQERNLGIVSAHLFKPLGKTSRVARSLAIHVAEAEPSSGEANSFLTPSCFDPAVKCTTVPWSWSSPAASNRKIPQGGHYKGRCGALSPCLRYLMDSNVETGIQKQGHGPETTLPRITFNNAMLPQFL